MQKHRFKSSALDNDQMQKIINNLKSDISSAASGLLGVEIGHVPI